MRGFGFACPAMLNSFPILQQFLTKQKYFKIHSGKCYNTNVFLPKTTWKIK